MNTTGLGQPQQNQLPPGESIARTITYKVLTSVIQDPREVYGFANHLVKQNKGSWKQTLRMIGEGGSDNAK